MKLKYNKLPIPENTVLPLLCSLLLQALVFQGTKPLMAGAYHHNFETAWDLAIPFLPWTVLIYAGAFLYWFLAVVLIMQSGKENAFRFLWAHCISLLIALLFFVLLPTTNTRPEVQEGGLWNWGMRLVYFLDTPDNLFPSLHCELSWLCWRSLRQSSGISKFGKNCALVFTLLVFVSTLTTKQHILIDVFGGWLIAELAFRLCGKEAIMRPFYKVFDR